MNNQEIWDEVHKQSSELNEKGRIKWRDHLENVKKLDSACYELERRGFFLEKN